MYCYYIGDCSAVFDCFVGCVFCDCVCVFYNSIYQSSESFLCHEIEKFQFSSFFVLTGFDINSLHSANFSEKCVQVLEAPRLSKSFTVRT